MRNVLVCLFVFFAFVEAEARSNLDFSIHQQYIAARSMGAGGAISHIDDYNVLFLNPAGLARLEEGQVHAGFQFATSFNPSYLDFANQISSSEGSASDIADILVDNQGNTYHSRLPTVRGIWARPGWGIGLNALDLSLNVGVQQFAVGVKGILDNTLAFGYAKHFDKKKDRGLSVGVTSRLNYRAATDLNYTAADLATSSELFREDDVNEAIFIDFDIGAMWTPRIPKKGIFSIFRAAKPTFSLVARNVLDDTIRVGMNLLSENSGGEPENPQRRFDIGSRWDLPEFWVFKPRLMVDVRDIGHDFWTLEKGSHIGAELGWLVSDWFQGSWRIGLNQGYPTFGFMGQAMWFRLDLVTWGEEYGTTGAKQENRVAMAKMSVNF